MIWANICKSSKTDYGTKGLWVYLCRISLQCPFCNDNDIKTTYFFSKVDYILFQDFITFMVNESIYPQHRTYFQHHVLMTYILDLKYRPVVYGGKNVT